MVQGLTSWPHLLSLNDGNNQTSKAILYILASSGDQNDNFVEYVAIGMTTAIPIFAAGAASTTLTSNTVSV